MPIDLVQMHNEAFAPLNSQLAQQSKTTLSTVETLAKLSQQEQIALAKASQEAGQQITAQDYKKWQFGMSHLDKMAQDNPELANQVWSRAMQAPKWAALANQFGTPSTFGDKLYATKADEAANYRDPQYRQNLIDVAASKDANTALATQQANSMPGVAQAQIQNEQQKTITPMAANLANIADPTLRNIVLNNDLANKQVQAEVQQRFEQTNGKMLTAEENLKRQRDTLASFIDSQGSTHVVSIAYGNEQGWKQVQKQSASPDTFDNSVIYHRIAMKKFQHALDAGLAADAQTGTGAVDNIATRYKKLPDLMNSYRKVIEAQVKQEGDSTLATNMAQKAEAVQKYVDEPEYRSTARGKALYSILEKEYNDSVMPNPMFMIIKDIPPSLKPEGDVKVKHPHMFGLFNTETTVPSTFEIQDKAAKQLLDISNLGEIDSGDLKSVSKQEEE